MTTRVQIIKCATAARFNLTVDQLMEKTHQRAIARPRQIAMYLCRKMTRRSLPGLARQFGGTHHTTILWAEKRIGRLLLTDEQVSTDVEALTEAVKPLFETLSANEALRRQSLAVAEYQRAAASVADAPVAEVDFGVAPMRRSA